jgi:3-mercaptopyruvate sulfurtransferase SseA
MKISVSLPRIDIQYLDEFAAQHGIGSRSATIQFAVDRLRHDALGDAYEQAWDDWSDSDDAAAWETAAADGLARP